MKDSKDEENVVGLIVASASAGVLVILAVAAVIVCCKHHRASEVEVEEEEEGEENNCFVLHNTPIFLPQLAWTRTPCMVSGRTPSTWRTTRMRPTPRTRMRSTEWSK